MTTFDWTKEFEEKCQKHLDAIQRQCEIYAIPFVFTACVKNDENGSQYIGACVGTGSSEIKLHDDKINKHLLVQAGFDVIPHRNEIELTMLADNADPDDI